MDACPVCKNEAQLAIVLGNDPPGVPQTHQVQCKRCGRFSLTSSAAAMLQVTPLEGRQAAVVSGHIRENEGLTISEYDVDGLHTMRQPPPDFRARRLLRYIAGQYPDAGAWADIDTTSLEVLARAWAINPMDVRYLLSDYLGARGYLEVKADSGHRVHFVITPEGWRYIYSQRINHRSVLAFVAMNFVEETKRLREEGIKPAVISAGYNPRLIDEVQHNKHIDDEIIANLRQSKFVVADLTNHRPSVYYEAGYAQGLGLEVLWTVRQDHLKEVGFDTRQYPFILWTDATLGDFSRQLAIRIIARVGPGSVVAKV